MRYRAGLLKLVAQCRQVVEERVSHIEHQWPVPVQAGDSIRVGDALPITIQQWIRSAKDKLRGIWEWVLRLLGKTVRDTAVSVDERLAAEVQRSMGIDIAHLLAANGAILSTAKAAINENALLVKSLIDQYFDRITKTVGEGWNNGTAWKDVLERIKSDGIITENRAKLIAEDQSWKMNASFNRDRQTQIGIESYLWITRRDDRVRPSHRVLDGKEFRWDSPPIVDGEAVHPGQAIRCRCFAQPIIDTGDEALGYVERGVA